MRLKLFFLLMLCPYIQTVWASGECTTTERPTYDDTYGYCYTESVNNGVNCTIPQQTKKQLQKWASNLWVTETATSATITTLTFSYNNAISATESLGCDYNVGTKFCVTYDNNGNAYQIGTQIINSTDDTTPDAATAFTPSNNYDICLSSYKNSDKECVQYGQQLEKFPITVISPTCKIQGYVQDNTPQTGDFISAKYFCMQNTCNEDYHFEADERNLTCFGTPIGKCVSDACKDILPGCGETLIKQQATGNTTWNDKTKQYNVSECTCTSSTTANNTTYQITYKWSQDTYDKNSPQGQWTEDTRTITKCAQGYYKETDDATSCTPVGRGYYSSSDKISREKCPIGSTTSSTTESSITSCHLTNDTKFCDQENNCKTINFNNNSETNKYPSHTNNKIFNTK